MTKYTLEGKFDECFDKHTAPTGGGYEADYTDRRGFYNEFQPIILEYAKQEAIEFKKWCDEIEGALGYGNGRSLTTEELYEFYNTPSIFQSKQQ